MNEVKFPLSSSPIVLSELLLCHLTHAKLSRHFQIRKSSQSRMSSSQALAIILPEDCIVFQNHHVLFTTPHLSELSLHLTQDK